MVHHQFATTLLEILDVPKQTAQRFILKLAQLFGSAIENDEIRQNVLSAINKTQEEQEVLEEMRELQVFEALAKTLLEVTKYKDHRFRVLFAKTIVDILFRQNLTEEYKSLVLKNIMFMSGKRPYQLGEPEQYMKLENRSPE